MIPSPYLLYLGNLTEALSVKTSRGVAAWRPELCIGEFRGEACTLTVGLDHLSFAQAYAQGAKTLIIGKCSMCASPLQTCPSAMVARALGVVCSRWGRTVRWARCIRLSLWSARW